MADYWIVEKQLIHKLFKVLVPRFENYDISFTRMFNAPNLLNNGYKKAILELRGNPYPSLVPNNNANRNLIHNVLLDEAKKAYRLQKSIEIASKIGDVESKQVDKLDAKLSDLELEHIDKSRKDTTKENELLSTSKDLSPSKE